MRVRVNPRPDLLPPKEPIMTGTHGVLFSLIVPTLNRREDVRRLLASIEAQGCQDFEVIIVDQNPNALLDDVCRDFAQRMPLLHLRTESKGAAHARNHGLGFAKGAIINFPDDDCEFTPELLARVAAQFDVKAALDALFGRTVDPVTGESSVAKFDSRSQWVTRANVYHTTVEATMFARRGLFDDVGLQDESLGVGTFFGAEEGADFVLRALYKQKRLFYDPSFIMHHPQKVARYDAGEMRRALSYGRGFGRMSVKHVLLYRQRSAAIRFLKFQFRAAAGVVLCLVRLQPRRSWYYVTLIRGRLSGVVRSWQEFRKAGKTARGSGAP